MIVQKHNLYSSLYRWAHRQSENFCTDALVFLINHLLAEEHQLGLRLVNWLCFKVDHNPDFETNGLHVTTQIREAEGTPDIWIKSDSFVCLIEVKKGSDLHDGQLEQYRLLLDRMQNANTRLVLLTVFYPTIDEEKPDLHLFWSEVASWFVSHPAEKPESQFLVRQFLEFLKDQIMTFEQVTFQFVEGTKSFFTFGNMLGKALGDANVPLHSRAATSGWEHRGYYTEGMAFWVGVYLVSPDTLHFEFSKGAPDNGKLEEVGRFQFVDGKHRVSLELSSEPVHFFSRNAEDQLAYLTEWVRNAYRDGVGCLQESDNG